MPDEQYAFRQWVRKVDDICWTLSGVPVDDLSPQSLQKWFDDKISAERAAIWALQDAGCTFGRM